MLDLTTFSEEEKDQIAEHLIEKKHIGQKLYYSSKVSIKLISQALTLSQQSLRLASLANNPKTKPAKQEEYRNTVESHIDESDTYKEIAELINQYQENLRTRDNEISEKLKEIGFDCSTEE